MNDNTDQEFAACAVKIGWLVLRGRRETGNNAYSALNTSLAVIVSIERTSFNQGPLSRATIYLAQERCIMQLRALERLFLWTADRHSKRVQLRLVSLQNGQSHVISQ